MAEAMRSMKVVRPEWWANFNEVKTGLHYESHSCANMNEDPKIHSSQNLIRLTSTLYGNANSTGTRKWHKISGDRTPYAVFFLSKFTILMPDGVLPKASTIPTAYNSRCVRSYMNPFTASRQGALMFIGTWSKITPMSSSTDSFKLHTVWTS